MREHDTPDKDSAHHDIEGADQGARFAPADPLDNRGLGEWDTRWEPEVWKRILWEAWLLVAFFFGSLLVIGAIWWLPLSGHVSGQSPAYIQFAKYALAFSGGMFGGTLLDIKWLYHTVAKGSWNRDRVLWRLMTPLLSAGTAFMFMALLSSGILLVIDRNALAVRSVALAVVPT